jgi:hypothetical protein
MPPCPPDAPPDCLLIVGAECPRLDAPTPHDRLDRPTAPPAPAASPWGRSDHRIDLCPRCGHGLEPAAWSELRVIQSLKIELFRIAARRRFRVNLDQATCDIDDPIRTDACESVAENFALRSPKRDAFAISIKNATSAGPGCWVPYFSGSPRTTAKSGRGSTYSESRSGLPSRINQPTGSIISIRYLRHSDVSRWAGFKSSLSMI